MTSRLTILRSRLARLRRVRAVLRWLSAWSALVSSVLVGLFAIYLFDLLFALTAGQRIVAMLLATAGIGWSFWRFTLPLLGHRESELESALLVERQEQIDSDLVAALQFEQPQATSWGSPRLSAAVIDYVSAATPTIDVLSGISPKHAIRRVALCATLLFLAALFAMLAPAHAAAFFNRLLLGSMHYPTRTKIDEIVVGGNVVFTSDMSSLTPADCKAAQGQPLAFEVRCSGWLPADGSVRLAAIDATRGKTRIALKAAPSADRRTVLLTGELPRLSEDVTYKITAGDAWTDAALVIVIPLPIVEVKLSATPPQYAAGRAERLDPSGRQFAVLEGSSIDMTVSSTNQKRLKSVAVLLERAGRRERIECTPRDDDRLAWSLPAENSPLRKLREEVRYEVQAIDEDGLSPQTPQRGAIRIKPDQPPTSVAELVHRVVLPTAQPVVNYRATDDYGISRLALIVEVQRSSQAAAGLSPAADLSADSAGQLEPARAIAAELHRYEIRPTGQPVTSAQLPLTGRYALALAPLKLAKGDRLKLTLEATDYRGENEKGEPAGQAALADPLVLEISDEAGVLAAISQGDLRSEEKLSEIIKRQLGIGDEP
jgi:hypothetical protein